MLTKQNLPGKKNWVGGNSSFSFVACDFSIQSLPSVTHTPTLIYPCLNAAVVFVSEWLWRLMEQIPIYVKANLGLTHFLTDCKNALQCLWAGFKNNKKERMRHSAIHTWEELQSTVKYGTDYHSGDNNHLSLPQKKNIQHHSQKQGTDPQLLKNHRHSKNMWRLAVNCNMNCYFSKELVVITVFCRRCNSCSLMHKSALATPRGHMQFKATKLWPSASLRTTVATAHNKSRFTFKAWGSPIP